MPRKFTIILIMSFIPVLLFGLTACEGKALTQGGKKMTATVKKYKMLKCIDQQGFGIEVFRMLVPQGWQGEGGVLWNGMNPAMPATISYTAFAPDQWTQFEIFPIQTSIGMPPASVLEALEMITHQLFRNQVNNLRVMDKQILPELGKDREKEQAANLPPNVSGHAEAGMIEIEYEFNGQTLSEKIFGTMETYTSTVFGIYGPQALTHWRITDFYSFKSKKEVFSQYEQTFQLIFKSFKLNPVWKASFESLAQQLAMNQIQMSQADIARRCRAISQTLSEIGDMSMESYRQTSMSQDRIAENFSNNILNIDKYYDSTANSAVELPSGYNDVWANGLGEYILTDDSNFNPNVTESGNWTRIERSQ